MYKAGECMFVYLCVCVCEYENNLVQIQSKEKNYIKRKITETPHKLNVELCSNVLLTLKYITSSAHLATTRILSVIISSVKHKQA